MSDAELLRSVVASSYGPKGLSKVLHAGSSLTVSTISYRLSAALRLEHPLMNVLAEFVAALQTSNAGSGLFAVILASSLVIGARCRRLSAQSCGMFLPAILDCSLQRVLDAPPDGYGVPVSLRLGDLQPLLGLVRAVLSPKRVALPGGKNDDIEWLVRLVVHAFMHSVANVEGNEQAVGSPLLSGVRILGITGLDPAASDVCQGVVLDTPLPVGVVLAEARSRGGTRTRCRASHVVALYDVNLEAALPVEPRATARLRIARAAGLGSCGSGDFQHGGEHGTAESLFRLFADGVASLGVTLLCCKKRIAPPLIRLLVARGITPLPRPPRPPIAAGSACPRHLFPISRLPPPTQVPLRTQHTIPPPSSRRHRICSANPATQRRHTALPHCRLAATAPPLPRICNVESRAECSPNPHA